MSAITGIRGGINPQSNQSGVEALKGLGRADADQRLTSLRNDLQVKTGVVRLLHTSSADKDMKFKNAGAFKQVFLAGDKLKRSGEVIEKLLVSAGLSEANANAFHAYVERRGNRGVEAQQVLKYIDTLRAAVGGTPREAIESFGVTLDQNNRAEGTALGSGAYAEAVLVRYRNEDYVYKQPIETGKGLNNDLPLITDIGLAGAGVDAVQQAEQRSDADYDPDKSDASSKGPAQPGGKLLHFQMLPNDSSELGDSSDDEFRDLNDRPGRQSFRDTGLTIAPKALIVEEPTESSGSLGGPDLEQPVDQPQLQPGNGAGPAQASAPVSTSKLARTGLGAAARVKDLPQVITPSVYVIEELMPGAARRYHAVAGQQRLKNWARKQQPGSNFVVVGLLMPKAKGKSPIEYPTGAKGRHDNPRLNVARSDLKAMAQSSLELLKGLASHGFIHGDVKPDNLIWDSRGKTLQLIDNDGLTKVSKAPGTQVPEGLSVFTLKYTNPVVYDARNGGGKKSKAGLGRDLFSIGLVLLEASLMARGDTERAKKLMEELTVGSASTPAQAMFRMREGKYMDGLKALENEAFTDGSVENFARNCIVRSIEHERARLNGNEFGFERYTPDNDQHLLAELERELRRVDVPG